MSFTKNDFYILDTMNALKATNPLGSVPITTFIKTTKLSHTKIRAALNLLIEAGFAKEGYKEFNAKTYYITDLGMEQIKNINETAQIVLERKEIE